MPRCCALLSRPLRVLPCPFLCAMSRPSAASGDLGDRDPRVLLAVAEAAPVVLPPLELLHVELGALDVALHARRDLGAVDVGGADLLARDEDLLEDVLAAGLGAGQQVDEQRLPGVHEVLASPVVDDGLHASAPVKGAPC